MTNATQDVHGITLSRAAATPIAALLSLAIVGSVAPPAIAAPPTTHAVPTTLASDSGAAQLVNGLESQGRQTGVPRVRYDESGRVTYILLSGELASAGSVALLPSFPYLTDLTINCPPHFLDDQSLAPLGRLPKVRYLRLRGACRMLTPAVDAALAQLRDLRSISIQEISVSPATLDFLRQMPALRALAITSTRSFDDRCVAVLIREAPGLKELDLHGTGITDACLHDLAQLAELKQLNAGDTKITLAAFRRAKLDQRVKLSGVEADGRTGSPD